MRSGHTGRNSWSQKKQARYIIHIYVAAVGCTERYIVPSGRQQQAAVQYSYRPPTITDRRNYPRRATQEGGLVSFGMYVLFFEPTVNIKHVQQYLCPQSEYGGIYDRSMPPEEKKTCTKYMISLDLYYILLYIPVTQPPPPCTRLDLYYIILLYVSSDQQRNRRRRRRSVTSLRH